MKSVLSLREPVEFRGGNLFCLAKRVGASLKCEHYRSILISGVPAKIFHRYVRGLLVPLHAAAKSPLQLGALGGIGIEAISLTARSFQLLCHHSRCPWSIVFVDVQAAFYRIVRQALTSHQDSDVGILRLLQRMGMPPQAVVAMREQLERLSILATLKAPNQVSSIVQDMMRSTWFRIDTSDILTLTQCGSRPGDPAADILFALSFGEFLRAIGEEIKEQGLTPELPRQRARHPWVPQDHELSIGAPAWADDFFLPQTGSTPVDLLSRTKRTIELVVARATSMGMRLTFAPTKTALLLPTTADWTQLSAHVLQEDDQAYMPVVDVVAEETHRLPLVQTYKHLGGILTSTTNPRPDLLLRQNQALGVTKPLRKQLFHNRDIPLLVRRTLLRALSVSRLVHSASSLILLAAMHQRLWDRAYVQVWRALLPRTAADKQPHSVAVLKAAQAPSPPLALAKARSSFLKQLTVNGPSDLKCLLFDHWKAHPRSSWLHQLSADVKLVSAYVSAVRDLVGRSCVVTAILDSYLEEPSWWPRQVNKAIHAFQLDIEQAVLYPLEPISGRVLDASSECAPGEQRYPRPFVCHICSSGFMLRKHLGVHLAKKHGILSPYRYYSYGESCVACNRWLGDVRRVQAHLKANPSCLRRACQILPPLSHADIRTAEAEVVQRDKMLRQGKWEAFRAGGPPKRVYGPLIPTADERLLGLDFLEEDITLDVLAPLYYPSQSIVTWINDHIAAKSIEGPRPIAASYWHRGPFCKSFHQN